MGQFFKINLLVFGSLLIFGCSSSLKVTSEPDQAKVFIVNKDSKESKLIGKTPFTKKGQELKDILKGQSAPGGVVNLQVKKKGFKTTNFWLPVNASGSLGAELALKLEKSQGEIEMTTAKQVIEKLFLAQEFARSQQMERALIEIDEVLDMYPDFDRALTMKAAINYAKGNFKESLKWYESALAVNPELKNAVKMSGKVRKLLKMPVRDPKRLPAENQKKSNDNEKKDSSEN